MDMIRLGNGTVIDTRKDRRIEGHEDGSAHVMLVQMGVGLVPKQ